MPPTPRRVPQTLKLRPLEEGSGKVKEEEEDHSCLLHMVTSAVVGRREDGPSREWVGEGLGNANALAFPSQLAGPMWEVGA